MLPWLVLSHIGIDVLDEWVFSCQGVQGLVSPLHPPYWELKRIFIGKKSKNFLELTEALRDRAFAVLLFPLLDEYFP